MTDNTNDNGIHIIVDFLDIVKDETGRQLVPLKSIVDQVGLDWKTQKRKLIKNEALANRLGFKLLQGGRPQYFIRLDRISAYLNNLSPNAIGGGGNTESASRLSSKHTEWDDPLHEFDNSTAAHSTTDAMQDEALRKIQKLIDIDNEIDGIQCPVLKAKVTKIVHDAYGINPPNQQEQPNG